MRKPLHRYAKIASQVRAYKAHALLAANAVRFVSALPTVMHLSLAMHQRGDTASVRHEVSARQAVVASSYTMHDATTLALATRAGDALDLSLRF